MNLALPSGGFDLQWAQWSQGTADLDYTPTGAGAGQPARTVQPGWTGAALAATLSLVGVTAATVHNLLVGTGGTADYLTVRNAWDTATSVSQEPLFAGLGEEAALAPDKVLAGADLVAGIKATLGLSVTDLAAIARVSRQTIYDWIGEGQVSEAKYARLRALHQVCLDWQARVDRPVGRLLHAKDAKGRSLLDLLAAESLDRQAVRLHLDALTIKATEQTAERQARQARLAPLGEKDRYENALTHALPAADS